LRAGPLTSRAEGSPGFRSIDPRGDGAFPFPTKLKYMLSMANISLANESRIDDLAMSLMDAVLLSSRRLRQWMREGAGVSMPQFRVLSFLERRGSSSLSELASYLGVSLPSASRLVDGMSSRGLIEACDDPSDRRRLLLRLTDKGRETLASARARALGMLSARLSWIPRGDVLRSIEVLMSAMGGD